MKSATAINMTRPKNNDIYLAHPYDKRYSKRKEMIAKKLTEKGFNVVDPFDGEDNIAEKYGVKTYYENPWEDFAREIVNRDFKQVDECDALFAWIPKGVTMIGTVKELVRAEMHGKHTIVLCYKPNPFLVDVSELYLSYQDFLDHNKFIWL